MTGAPIFAAAARTILIGLLLAASLTLATPRAHAQTSTQAPAQTQPQPVTGVSTQPPPALKPELQPFLFFVGHWDCAGEFPASKKQISAHVEITPDLDGSWLMFRWDDQAPNRFHAVEFWGYNKTGKHFSNFIYDNFGGARLFESKGWDADTLTWVGDMLPAANGADAQINQRFVLERKSAKEFVISYATHKPQADWVTVDRLTCKQ
ncbi:MAG TPA: DUF1579 family protein [Candidatus Acidoferrales bacterium]